MIFEMQAIKDDGDFVEKRTFIVTTFPVKAWEALARELEAKDADDIVLRYWHMDGTLRSQYNIDLTLKIAYLYDGDETPTILKGIKHYLSEAK